MQELLEKAKTDKRLLCKLKILAVEAKLYELGASLREIELANFPESTEQKEAMENAKGINLLLRMVGIDCPEKTCWMLHETMTVYRKKKGKFDLMDASRIKAKANELFLES